MFRGRWPEWSVLDIGIGAGRTTGVFATVAGRYLGIDYAPKMVEYCRAQLPDDDAVSVEVADARDLSQFGRDAYDFAMFSFNGIYPSLEWRPWRRDVRLAACLRKHLLEYSDTSPAQ